MTFAYLCVCEYCVVFTWRSTLQISSSVWGFKRILDAMRCHPTNSDVQEQVVACVL